MSDVSPTAAALQLPSNRPSQLAIRQAYRSERGRRLSNRGPYAQSTTQGGVQRQAEADGHLWPTGKRPSHDTRQGISSVSQDQPTITLGTIIAHDNRDNKQAALELKAFLYGESEGENTENAIISSPHSELPVVEAVKEEQASAEMHSSSSSTERYRNNILQYAFQQQYSADWRHRDISHMPDNDHEEDWKNQNKYPLPPSLRTYARGDTIDPSQPPLASYDHHIEASVNRADNAHKEVKPIISHQISSERLKLEGLDEGRARNEYGRTLQSTGGQQTGFGVIGHISPSADTDQSDTIVITEAGCDTPMMKETYYTQSQIRLTPDEGDCEKASIAGQSISLNPDLPPLAMEHPARVWNCMIHSLQPDLQPVIQWKYRKIPPSGNGSDQLWEAELTLVLPPTHPIINEHPMFHTLPKNKWKVEYASAVEALGGIQRWSGEARRLKADAQNTTLVKCISENALAWVLAPTGLRATPDDEDEDEGESAAARLIVDSTQNTSGTSLLPGTPTHPPHVHLGVRDLPNRQASVDTSTVSRNADEIDVEIEEEDYDDGVLPNPAVDKTPRTQMSSTSSGIETQIGLVASKPKDTQPAQTPFQELMQAINANLGPAGLNLPKPVSFSNNWEPFTNRFGCSLTIGTPEHSQLYQEDCLYTYAEEAQDAVCAKALALNAFGFMEWLKETLQPPIMQNVGRSPPSLAKIIVRPPKTSHDGVPFEVANRVDWKARLKAYCEAKGEHAPGYQEREVLYKGEHTIVCEVTVGGQSLSIVKGQRSTAEAEDYASRRILEDHFNQKTD
ncbi:uncharacterized protein I303_103642 [Kwoniella dejecticola CBS 10117]|uniref:Uncharacterized protein n=1 Tax=Kwoniella dejecticola CBS 10117 TaxID=1296121 RepID=A0A1A6A7B9_9TREE|nr:uncharacterized protein I303_03663 [Kwoniella dejecticola CBS 10117]OBR85948.1 hypothetical protein I303_03663 [Kwoniella dejecticola CBS 10117]